MKSLGSTNNKNPFRELARGSLIYGLGAASTQFISVILLPIFTKYLSPTDYGVFYTLNMLSVLLTYIFTLGFSTSIAICYFDKGDDQKEKTIWTSFILLVASSVLMLLIGLFGLKVLNELLFHGGSYSDLILMTIVRTLFIIIGFPFILRLQFEHRQFKFASLMAVYALSSIAITYLLVVTVGRGLLGNVEGVLLSSVLYFVLFFIFASRDVGFGISKSISKDLLVIGLPAMPSFIGVFILQQGGIFILKTFSTLENVGLYSVGFTFGTALLILVTAFITEWTPFFLGYTNKREKAKVLFGKVFEYYVFIVGMVSLAFYIFSKPVILVFTQPEFLNAYKVIGLTATAQLLSGMFSIISAPIYFAKKVKYITLAQLISGGLFVILGTVMVSAYGMVGVALALVIAYIIMNLATCIWISGQDNTWLKIQYHWKRIIIFSVSYFLVAFFILFEKNLNSASELFVYLSLSLLMGIEVYLLLSRDEKNETSKIFSVPRRKRILVLYKIHYTSVRETILEHLYSFQNYVSDVDFIYFNVVSGVPRYLSLLKLDGVIIHYTFLSERFFLDRKSFRKYYRNLKYLSGLKVAIPQDEYDETDALCELFKSCGVSTILTCFKRKEDQKKAYPRDKSGVEDIRYVLTGYVDEKEAKRLGGLAKSYDERPIDIGYKARKLLYSLGKHAQLKYELVKIFQEKLKGTDFFYDISNTRDTSKESLSGKDWYNFLLKCKAFLGCEGGASLLDRDGTIKRRVEDYMEKYPNASFDEVEKNIFSGMDFNIRCFTVSPRHFEAAMTKTLQILVEGKYDGIFKPGVHYLELKKDFSNIDSVLEKLKDLKLCQEIIDRAHKDIVLSGKYTYKNFVQAVIDNMKKSSGIPKYSNIEGVLFLVLGKFIYIRNAGLKVFIVVLGKVVLNPLENTAIHLYVKRNKKLLTLIRRVLLVQ